MPTKLISSINALAELVDKSAPAVQKWLRNDAWTFGKPPWPMAALPKIKAWAAENLQEDRASGDERERKTASGGLTAAKAQKLLREIRLLDITLTERRGEVHAVAECEQQQIMRITQTKLALTTHVPTTMVQTLRERERSLGRPLADLEMKELFRQSIESAITQHLAGGHTA